MRFVIFGLLGPAIGTATFISTVMVMLSEDIPPFHILKEVLAAGYSFGLLPALFTGLIDMWAERRGHSIGRRVATCAIVGAIAGPILVVLLLAGIEKTNTLDALPAAALFLAVPGMTAGAACSALYWRLFSERLSVRPQ